ncbi:MAG TPA: hypothetical protein DEA26_04540 [Oceanospirillales bacterium]|nr:hypothetical protein [Oceanospirillales bacterium]|tara:strand:- start:780 stop:1226 length:447 start_codon:yes stop_codon:yes gene_type:complete
MIRDSSSTKRAALFSSLEQELRALLPQMFREYQSGVNRDLSRQRYEGVFSRRLLISSAIFLAETEVVISDYLKRLCEDRERVLETAERVVADLLQTHAQSVLQHNQKSVALADYPEEQNPSVGTFCDTLVQVEGLRSHWRGQIHSQGR